jgi:hypothetical protein
LGLWSGLGVTVTGVVVLLFLRDVPALFGLVVVLRLDTGVDFGLAGDVLRLFGEALVAVALFLVGDGLALGYAKAFLLVRFVFGGMI